MILRPYQMQCIHAIYDYFSHSQGNPLVVVPTGGGKSVIIAKLCQGIIDQYPDQRILILSHVKELISQNTSKIVSVWPDAPIGVYCASLKKKQAGRPITIASIQSVHKHADKIGYKSLIFIDECHLVSANDEGMYRSLIRDMRRINPYLKVIGFSATPFRTTSGYLHQSNNALFTDIAIEIPIMRLVNDGYLSRLIGKPSIIQADVSKIRLTGGDFNSKQSEDIFKNKDFTNAAIKEMINLAKDRKHWLIFCPGINPAIEMRDHLRAAGVSCETVNSKTPTKERDRLIADYQLGKFQCMTGANIFTTGFDYPDIDFIGMFRPTMSPGLYIQMLGRGMRISSNKQNCLVLDYVGNIERHGPVTHILPPTRQRSKSPDKFRPTCKICKICRTANSLDAEECEDCGYIFYNEREFRHDPIAANAELMVDALDNNVLKVLNVKYSIHKKKGRPNSLLVEYKTNINKIPQWLCFEHQGWARKKAEMWWKVHSKEQCPLTTLGAFLASKSLPAPKEITIKKKGEYYEITEYTFTTREGSVNQVSN